MVASPESAQVHYETAEDEDNSHKEGQFWVSLSSTHLVGEMEAEVDDLAENEAACQVHENESRPTDSKLEELKGALEMMGMVYTERVVQHILAHAPSLGGVDAKVLWTVENMERVDKWKAQDAEGKLEAPATPSSSTTRGLLDSTLGALGLSFDELLDQRRQLELTDPMSGFGAFQERRRRREKALLEELTDAFGELSTDHELVGKRVVTGEQCAAVVGVRKQPENGDEVSVQLEMLGEPARCVY